MLNTVHVRTFLAVIDTGSYSAAAESLHMSQPAVSQQIRALEEQLGEVRLFRRVGQRMVLTTAGEELAGSARELVALAERAEQHILALRGQIIGRLRIGCSPGGGIRWLPPLLATFRGLHPGVTITLEVGTSEILIEELNTGRLAMLLLEDQQRRRGWEYTAIASEGLVLIGPPGHPLLQQERVPPGVLRDHPLVLPPAGSPLRRSVDEALRRRNATITASQIVLETESCEAMLSAVQAGMGLAFVPEAILPARADGFGVVDLHSSRLQQDWFVARLRERTYPPAAAALFAFLTSPEARNILTRLGLQVAV